MLLHMNNYPTGHMSSVCNLKICFRKKDLSEQFLVSFFYEKKENIMKIWKMVREMRPDAIMSKRKHNYAKT